MGSIVTLASGTGASEGMYRCLELGEADLRTTLTIDESGSMAFRSGNSELTGNVGNIDVIESFEHDFELPLGLRSTTQVLAKAISQPGMTRVFNFDA